MTPLWIISILYNEKTTKYHPILFRHHGLPGACDAPRYKSLGHHTGGFVFRLEALEECAEMSVKLDGEVGLSLEKDFLWDGEEMPGMVLLFVEKDGQYLPV